MKLARIGPFLAGALLIMGMPQTAAAQVAKAGKPYDSGAQRRENSRKPEPERSKRDYDGGRTQKRENEALRRLQEPGQYERQRENPLERQRREHYEIQKPPTREKDRKPPGITNCVADYVPREAFPGDHVCVTPQTRAQAVRDNMQSLNRRNPTGAYGPDTCIKGYVWREAFPGDRVCVTPETRAQTLRDNSDAVNRAAR